MGTRSGQPGHDQPTKPAGELSPRPRDDAGDAPVVAGEEPVVLTVVGGVWWPGASTYLVADLHLGRAEHMGTHGIPMPAGMTARALELISGEIRRWGARRLLVLGDLLHAPAGITPELVRRVAAWRRECPCELVVVPGNHDRMIDRVEQTWAIGIAPRVLREGPFEFAHAPDDLSADRFGWCGHLHPAITMRRGPDAIKLRAFHLGERVGVLPAMCPLASGGGVKINADRRIFALAGDRVIEVTTPAARRTPRPRAI